MSKKPSVQYEYRAKRDRLEITNSLKKKSERKDLMKAPSSKASRRCGPRKEAKEAAKKSLEGNQNTCGRRLIVRASAH